MDKKGKNIVLVIMNTMSSCVGPVVPVLAGCGVIKLLVLLLDMAGAFAPMGDTQALLTHVNSAPFYFLPLLVAYASAKHFGCNPAFALASVTVMLYPEFVSLLADQEAVSFLGIPVLQATYSYGVIPAIALVAAMKWIELGAEKWIPGPLKSTFVPTVVILLTGLLGILAIGPSISITSGWISDGIGFLQTSYPVVAWMVMGFFLPLMIMTGTHFIFTAIALEQLGSWGYEAGFHVTCFIMTLAVTGACMGVFLKSKGEIRQKALSHGVTILTTGVSEPALFGTLLQLRVPLLSAMMGTAVGAIWQGLHALHSYIFGSVSIFGVLIFASADEPNNLGNVLIAAGIGFAAAMVLTLLLYRQPKES